MSFRYNDVWAKTAAYLAWPDARLRAYLREHGVDETQLPGTRTGLLRTWNWPSHIFVIADKLYRGDSHPLGSCSE